MQRSLVVAVLLLAGCGAPPSGDDQRLADLVAQSEVDVNVTLTTGAVRGVVVDAVVNPVAGATASILEREARTDAAGTFGFDRLDPGVYFVQVRMEGFVSVEQAVTVVADQEPRWTRFVLERPPQDLPRFDSYRHEGFVTAGMGVSHPTGQGTLFNTGGGPLGNASAGEYGIGEPYAAVQSELIWDPAVPTNRLSLSHSSWPPIGNVGCSVARGSGPSPIVLRSFQGVSDTCVIEPPMILRVAGYAGWDSSQPASVGVALLQDFVVFTHVFYNFEPAEGWTFVEDGPPGR